MSDRPDPKAAKAAKAPATGMVTLRVTDLGPVDHDGQRYQAGEEFAVPAGAEAALLASKVAEAI